MFRIKLTARARRELKQITRTHQLAIGQIFEDLKEDPALGKPLMRELIGRFSYRVGIYRIVYKVSAKDKIVYVLTAGHRSGVYK